MRSFFSFSLTVCVCWGCCFYFPKKSAAQSFKLPPHSKTGKSDTIRVPVIPMEDEWIIYGVLPPIEARATISMEKYMQWLRLERAVRVVYPYAKEAGKRLLYLRRDLDALKTKKEKRQYIKLRERELLSQFTAPMKKLSSYQGGVLIKLINRESGNSCYELIKEYRGGFTAFFWERIARLFHNSLKEKYEPDVNEIDYHIELIVRELEANTDH